MSATHVRAEYERIFAQKVYPDRNNLRCPCGIKIPTRVTFMDDDTTFGMCEYGHVHFSSDEDG